MNRILHLVIICAVLIIWTCLPLRNPAIPPADASEPDSVRRKNSAETPPSTAQKQGFWETFKDVVEETHSDISEKLLFSANYVDTFFLDERYDEEDNRTQLRASLLTGYEKDEDFEVSSRFSMRLRFPNIEEKINLVISGDADEDFEDNRDLFGDSENVPEKDDNKIDTALQYFIRTTRRNNIKMQAGLRFSSTPVVYGGVRHRWFKTYDVWGLRFLERIRWYSDRGWETKAGIDLERSLEDRFFFRATLEGGLYEDISGLPHNLTLALFHHIGEDRGLKYEWGNYFTTSGGYEMSELILKVKYRQRFWRDWMVIEAAPYISFPESDDMEITPGITFRVDILFGYRDNANIF